MRARRPLALVAALVVLALVGLRCVATEDGALAPEPPAAGGGAGAERSASGTVSRREGARERARVGADSGADEGAPADAGRSEAAARTEPGATDDAASRHVPRADVTGWTTFDGRFHLFTPPREPGDPESPAPHFEDVAIDGDVAAAFDSARRQVHVFERRDGRWDRRQRVQDAGTWVPHARIAVSRGRILVSCSDAALRGFRCYARDDAGIWRLEGVGQVPRGTGAVDLAADGDTAVVYGTGLHVFRRGVGDWSLTQSLEFEPASAASWVDLQGDTLAACAGISPSEPVRVFRRDGDAFVAAAALEAGERGTLARGGDAVLRLAWNSAAPLVLDERADGGWASRRVPLGGVHAPLGGRGLDGDGDLVVTGHVTSFPGDRLALLHRRADGWYRVHTGPRRPSSVAGNRPWPAWNPRVALAGRSVVVTTLGPWDQTARVWFFDVTDEDLAAGTKIE